MVLPLSEEEDENEGEEEGIVEHNANMIGRIRQRRGRSLLLQGVEGLPTAVRLDHHLRQDCSKGKPHTYNNKIQTNTKISLSWTSSQR